MFSQTGTLSWVIRPNDDGTWTCVTGGWYAGDDEEDELEFIAETSDKAL